MICFTNEWNDDYNDDDDAMIISGWRNNYASAVGTHQLWNGILNSTVPALSSAITTARLVAKSIHMFTTTNSQVYLSALADKHQTVYVQ